jgi:glucuronokinase
MGNPSDGFFGRTISACISNFFCVVNLIPKSDPHDSSITLGNADCVSFASIDSCSKVCQKNGYYGSSRLFLATLKLFNAFCAQQMINMNRCGFTIFYNTSIPRQVGLAGSSALVTALIKALVQYYDIPESVLPLHLQANMALSAERDELGISAGYQDRVVQIYGGVISMNFDRTLMEGRGYGEYERLSPSLLPDHMWMGKLI